MERPATTTRTPVGRAEATTRQYRRAFETYDIDSLTDTLAPDVVFHSAVSLRARFEGRDQVRDLFQEFFATIDGISFHTDVGDGQTRTLFCRGRVGSREMESAVLVRLDEHATITEITAWIRPLPGLTAFIAAIGPRLARQYGRPRSARAVTALTKLLKIITHAGDGLLVRLIGISVQRSR